MKRWIPMMLALLLPLAASAAAGASGVRVLEAWARATPPVAPVAGSYLTVVNDGAQADRLLRVESDIAKRIEIHEMRNDNGVMRMRRIDAGLPLPAHGRLTLGPGGYHLMLFSPTRPLQAGGHFDAILVFEHAGKLPVTFEVRALGTAGH